MAERQPYATVYFCPLCDWEHVQPQIGGYHLGAEPFTAGKLAAQLAEVESALGGHLGTHQPVEWLTEVNRLRHELSRRDADHQAAERDSVLIAAILVRKLGGSTMVTDEEAASESGTLTRIPAMHGFRLTVHGARPVKG